MRQLSYFLFTSGEEGVHGIDWGIKSASRVLGDHRDLDDRYRKLLRDFGLSPSLERPENGVGVLLLPSSVRLMVFVFSGKDLKGRPNTIAIACNIPADISGAFSVYEVSRRIWSANDLEGIAQRGAVRPDMIVFPDEVDVIVFPHEATPSVEYPFVTSSALMKWPDHERGYFSIDRNIRELRRRELEEPRDKPDEIKDEPKRPSRKMLWVMAAVIIAVAVGGYVVFDSTPEPPAPTKTEDVPPKINPAAKTESPDRTNEEKPSPDVPEPSKVTASVDNNVSKDVPTVIPEDKPTESEDVQPESKPDESREALYGLLKPLYGKPYIDGLKITVRGLPQRSREKLERVLNTGYYSGIDSRVISELKKRLIPERHNERIRSLTITLEADERLPEEINDREDFERCIEIFVEQLLNVKGGAK